MTVTFRCPLCSNSVDVPKKNADKAGVMCAGAKNNKDKNWHGYVTMKREESFDGNAD